MATALSDTVASVLKQSREAVRIRLRLLCSRRKLGM
jgi:hypothetical protein